MSPKLSKLKTPNASTISTLKELINHSVFDALPDSGYVRESQLVQSPKRPGMPTPLPFSAPTLWRKVAAGSFPKPIKLSERVTCWNVGQVRSWMAAISAQDYAPLASRQKRTSKNEAAVTDTATAVLLGASK
jgi:predicted DNA-binding transcriptional regulator AlpA